jgi:hypothetical protein
MKIRELFENIFLEDFDEKKSVKDLKVLSNNTSLSDGVYYGDLNLSHFGLTDLEGSPREITGDFKCDYNLLTNLEGAPEIVNETFDCSSNKSLVTLKGSLKEVGVINASFCPKLQSLEYFPKQINISENTAFLENDFKHCDIRSLKGLPYVLWAGLDLSNNVNLTSLEGGPSEIIGGLTLYDCTGLTSLKGAPKKIDGTFECSGCPIISLEGFPQEGVYDVLCRHTNISSLQGIAREINGSLFLEDNHNLTSLKNIHKFIDTIDGTIFFSCEHVKSNVLGVLKIKGLYGVEAEGNAELNEILNRYLPNPTPDKIIDCQNELIEAGFEEYAEL